MKKLFFVIALVLIAASAPAQTVLDTGIHMFKIDGKCFPKNTVILNIRPDTSYVELDLFYTAAINGVLIPVQKRVKYIDGRTGLPFPSIGALISFYDQYMTRN